MMEVSANMIFCFPWSLVLGTITDHGDVGD